MTRCRRPPTTLLIAACFALAILFAASARRRGSAIPRDWDWRRVRRAEAAAWARANGRPLRAGSYSADVYDQHEHGYCGICFAVAPLQAVHDQLRIASQRGRDERIDLMWTASRLAEARQKASAGFAIAARAPSVCFGGDPAEVLELLRSGDMGLKFAPGGRHVDRVPEARSGPPPDVRVHLRAFAVQDASARHVKWYVYTHGPVVAFMCSARLTDDASEPELAERRDDHVVTVVGWRGDRFWIARNSWGRDGMTRARPSDPALHALQKTRRVPWRDDEGRGFFRIPMSARLNVVAIEDLRDRGHMIDQ